MTEVCEVFRAIEVMARSPFEGLEVGSPLGTRRAARGFRPRGSRRGNRPIGMLLALGPPSPPV